MRSLVATYLATTSHEWVDTFAKYNSGTYNCQWMLFDMKKFKPGSALQPDTFWVLEQVPGYVHAADMTQVLNDQGYWASYNIPYFEDIFDLCALPKHLNATSHDFCPRANIFRRDQAGVTSLAAAQKLMRYNDYQNDPLSEGLPNFAISARFDLIPVVGIPLGGVDAKITTHELFAQGKTWLYCGPSNEQVPPFDWSNRKWKDIAHEGVPVTDDFEWVLY
eukprot:TRINITY_DN3107_c0_g1_i2.p2 TRINITY_DN3107_c0_g1~~TRINITY_DN3107_c0_g1_i2.p2  ORF type:complete len:220 (+),score=49.09 TRINITY_DN3107_c0_g1_i2:944-1603(+)